MIRKAERNEAGTIAELAILLWPGQTAGDLAEEFEELLTREDGTVFLSFFEGKAVGFAQCQLRSDYVEGTSSSPVGYLEGLFVRNEYRNRGYGRKLLRACEAWAKERGCLEFASDCALANADSLSFHLRAGFSEKNRIICFAKRL